jgi:hypothetical protein
VAELLKIGGRLQVKGDAIGDGQVSLILDKMVRVVAESKDSKEKILSDFDRVHGKLIRAKVKAHLINFLENLKSTLRAGVSTSAPVIRVRQEDGGSATLPVAWEPLTKEYQKRKIPRYREVFWRGNRKKHGRPLLESFNAVYSRGRAVNISSKSTFDSSYGTKYFKSVARMKISTVVTVGSLGDNFLDEILSQSFLRGELVQPVSTSVSAYDLSKIFVVEGRRPFVSGLAVYLGKLLNHELRTFSGE